MHKYIFQNKEFNSYYELKKDPFFKNISMPAREEVLKAETLERFGIQRVEVIPTLEETKAKKKAEIARERYKYETNGVDVNGTTVASDRDSVAMLKGAYDEAREDSSYTVNWKAEQGFVTLTAEQIIAIYRAVKNHVQSAFDKEMAIDLQIDSATTIEEINSIEWEV